MTHELQTRSDGREPFVPQRFQYTPLPDITFTRLASLAPGHSSSPIAIELSEVPISSDAVYEALSYEWKEKIGTHPIACNGAEILVTANLKDALLALRRPDKYRLFWIDSICINQNDPAEKSTHIMAMKSIYQNAFGVLVWLGKELRPEDPGSTADAFELLPVLADIWKSLLEKGINISRPDLFSSAWNPDDLGKLDIGNEARWDGLIDLITRPYFSRTWVVQEIIVSSRTSVICGQLITSWNTFGSAVHALMLCSMYVTRLTDITIQSRYLNLYGILMAQRRFHQECKLQLLGLLTSFQALLATDPRDKIYATLGLVVPYKRVREFQKEVLIVPDYTKSVAQVYTETASYLIWERQDLYLWTFQPPTGRRKIRGLPSWVPDWAEKQDFVGYRNDISGLHKLIDGKLETSNTSLFVNGSILGYVVWSISLDPFHLDSVVDGSQLPNLSIFIDAFVEIAGHLNANGIGMFDIYHKMKGPDGTEIDNLQNRSSVSTGDLSSTDTPSPQTSSSPTLVIEAVWRTLYPGSHPLQYITEDLDPAETGHEAPSSYNEGETNFLAFLFLVTLHRSIVSELSDEDIGQDKIDLLTMERINGLWPEIPEKYSTALLTTYGMLQTAPVELLKRVAYFIANARYSSEFLVMSDGSFALTEAGEAREKEGLAVAVMGGGFSPVLLKGCGKAGREWWELKATVFVEWLLDLKSLEGDMEVERMEIR
jgi:hypothetical protein